MRARICVSFRCNRIKERTHVRQCRMVALLCNSQRNGTINKTKQKTQPKDKEAKSAEERRKKGKVVEATIIQKKSDA